MIKPWSGIVTHITAELTSINFCLPLENTHNHISGIKTSVFRREMGQPRLPKSYGTVCQREQAYETKWTGNYCSEQNIATLKPATTDDQDLWAFKTLVL